jgi:hypothetical protein
MRRKRIERELAERLLSGAIPEGAPENLASAARSLDLLRTAAPVDPARAAATVAAMSAIVSGEAPARRAEPVVRPRLIATGPRLAAVALAGAMLASSGLALTGALPGGAQDAAHDVLSKIGVNVPRAHHAHPKNKGDEVSGVAHSTSPDGGKGPEVSESASEGKSRAGDDHGRGADHRSTNGDDRGGRGDDERATPAPSPASHDGSDDRGSQRGSGRDGSPDSQPSPVESSGDSHGDSSGGSHDDGH